MNSPRGREVEILTLLCDRFPKTFFMYQERRKPLKLGIRYDVEAILGETVERKLLLRAMKIYIVNIGYLKSQRAGAVRIDLDGNPAGVVSEQEAIYAKRAIAGLKAVKKRKVKPAPKRDGFSALREAARKRREAAAAAGGGA
jgi:ProP effector